MAVNYSEKGCVLSMHPLIRIKIKNNSYFLLTNVNIRIILRIVLRKGVRQCNIKIPNNGILFLVT